MPLLDLLHPLTATLTTDRVNKIETILQQRTYSITTVLEEIYDKGNENAILRSAESFGFQSLHIIASDKKKAANRVTRGADKWLDIFHHKDKIDCILKLKRMGYQICATALSENALSIYELDFSRPTAIILGNEREGVSQTLKDLADHHCKIPSVGFSQSLNISVAAGICFSIMFEQRNQKLGKSGDLSPTEQGILKAIYMLRSIKNPDQFISAIINNMQPKGTSL